MANPLTRQQVQQSDIPVYVVPDQPGGQRMSYSPKTGAVDSWQSTLAQNLDAISKFQKDNPRRSPYPQGTKTVEVKKLEEGQRQFDESMAENKRQFDEDMAYKLAQAAKSGNKTGSGKNTNINAVLQGAINKYYELMENGVLKSDPLDSRGQVTHYSLTPEQAVQETTKLIYQNLNAAGLGVNDASSIIKAFESAIDFDRSPKEQPSYKQQYEDKYWQQKMEQGDFSMAP